MLDFQIIQRFVVLTKVMVAQSAMIFTVHTVYAVMLGTNSVTSSLPKAEDLCAGRCF